MLTFPLFNPVFQTPHINPLNSYLSTLDGKIIQSVLYLKRGLDEFSNQTSHALFFTTDLLPKAYICLSVFFSNLCLIFVLYL